jgi:hypothetical protein
MVRIVRRSLKVEQVARYPPDHITNGVVRSFHCIGGVESEQKRPQLRSVAEWRLSAARYSRYLEAIPAHPAGVTNAMMRL